MGPELSLAVVGVVLAGPGIAVAFRDFGAHVVKRIQTIKNAPDLIVQLQKVGRAICDGRLQSCIDIAEYAFSLEDLNRALHADLVRGLEQMREELLNIDALLEKLIEEDGSVSRAKLMLPPRWTWRTDAKRIIKRFDKIQNSFQLTITIAEARHRSLSVPEPLSMTKFKPRLKPDGEADYRILEENSHLWQGLAEIRDENGRAFSTRVLVERTAVPHAEILNIAGRLIKHRQDTGILKCLGYTQDEKAHLVFQTESASLHDQIRSLVSAKVYLTYWTMLRRMTDLSSRMGDVGWIRGIYQHPHRQGLQPQQRYNIGHDIYSLGVCLLEIGLWETLSVIKSETDALLVDANDSYDVSEQTMSDLYRNMALKQKLVGSDEIESIDALTEPSTVAKVLVALGQFALPQRVGTEYANIVVACLTSLEGGLGEEISAPDFFQNSTAVALIFKLQVVEALDNMY
ncbi:hypothetical protein IFR05_003972 [Cadophora sp. M221]|nr:hypothetical protein IFR05_003972 [Cadophora sp. M221]